MAMRITSLMTSRATVRDLRDDLARVSATQRKASTGKEITQPSDDPYGASLSVQLQGELDGLNDYKSSIDDGTAWLNASDAALTNISNIVQRARELLVQGASDSAGPNARAATAAEIDQLIESIKQEANVQYAGRYVFSGTATTTAPYQSGATDTYGGDAGTITREIGPNVTLPLNIDIHQLLGDGQAAADDKLLNTLRDISANLKGGTAADNNALRGTDLQRLDVNLDTLNAIRADVGARTNRLSVAGARIGTLTQNTMELLSQTQDADYAKTLTDFTTQQAAYNAALQMGARVVQNSLLDFLR